MKIAKYILAIIISVFILLGLLGLILSSKNVREAEYHHCMVTSTDKTICQSLK